MPFEGRENLFFVEVKLMDQKVIWGHRFDAKWLKTVVRKVFQVLCDYGVGATFYGGSEHVTVFRMITHASH